MFRKLFLVYCLLLSAALAQPVAACGGFFCQTSPVDQAAERIIFAKNDDGTITTIVQIDYTGSAPDFSWILPIPTPITADDIEVPEFADEAFTELHRLTDVQVIAPERPPCTERLELFAGDVVFESAAPAEMEGDVEIFAEGEVGPFGFVVIGSEDPEALINWLRDNEYRVDPPMEPLIDVYVEEQMVFLAMRLLPEETADSISPVQITYEAEKPMIPLRLTAVAANPNMGVFVWIFGDAPAVPENYEHMQILDGEISFTDFSGNNYSNLVTQRADALGGQAFITEYAGPTFTIQPNPINGLVTFDPLLNDLAKEHSHMTRLYTTISPEEMWKDPVFGFDSTEGQVNNVRDLRGMKGLYNCERDAFWSYTVSDAIETDAPDGIGVTAVAGTPDNTNVLVTWLVTILPIVGVVAFVGTRRRGPKEKGPEDL